MTMFLVGLTGGIATGKSCVARLLHDKGCKIIDADKIAREVVEPGTKAYRKIVQHFGRQILRSDRTIDRSKLGELIFSDEQERKLLNRITHPEIYKAMLWKIIIHLFRGEQFVILDLPLLFESAVTLPYLTEIIVVYCYEQQQYSRLKVRNQLTETEACQRIQSQLPLADKCRKATIVIDNSSTKEALEVEVDNVFAKLRSSRAHWKVRTVVFLLTGTLTGALGFMTFSLYKLFA
ncbi:dephospho-CoA kinase domain-containing protein-like [Tubulanus polymorphus]|uniref:dephospho-CoA kinase domain-containing protein-like n=1 Tax=Tubulanus polymorphus TaxID=672921 RepID=UPI003DA2E3DD